MPSDVWSCEDMLADGRAMAEELEAMPRQYFGPLFSFRYALNVIGGDAMHWSPDLQADIDRQADLPLNQWLAEINRAEPTML